jgi:hypothetical protein
VEHAVWKERIVQMVLIKQRIAELDIKQIWEHHLPRVAASGEQLAAAENALGRPLDPSYREFLIHANGWPAFYQTVDLFGTDDLVGSPEYRQGLDMLAAVEDTVLTQGGLLREELLLVAAARHDLDLFVLARGTGTVVWIAGSEVDRFDDFGEYFLAMMDYNREEVQDLERG